MHNMADPGSSTRVTYRKNPNFLERIGSSLAGILVGIALLGVSSYLIFWNEVRMFDTAKTCNVYIPEAKFGMLLHNYTIILLILLFVFSVISY